MAPSLDPVLAARALPKRKRIDWPFLLACALIFAFSLFMYHWEFQFEMTDLRVHARLASEFDFSDLHSITQRLAYPMWHFVVAVLYQLGMPLIWASSLVCALAKTAILCLTHKLLRVLTMDRVHSLWITLASFFLMFITGIQLPWFNSFVYNHVGSPTVWHNPTQLMVVVSMLLCIPYVAHCWCEFERRLPQTGEKTLLPWRMALALAALNLFSLSCKPTFMQAFLPACAVFFLVQWIRHPKNSRYFGQIILAFLPAVAYFLLQYLYYTGVVVDYTSGVTFGITGESAWAAARSLLIMAAFPLFALVVCYEKGMFKDKMLVLTLLMVACSVLEAMSLRETGLRQGHGNFNWASMTSALMLWILMSGKFMASFAAFLTAPRRPWYRFALYALAVCLLIWHLYSSGFYLDHLLRTNNAF